MGMKILFLSANTEKINIVPVPLGLSYVAAATRSRGHEVRVLDLMTSTDFRLSIRETIDSFNPDVIGVSVRNIDNQMLHGARFLLDDVRDVVLCCRSLRNVPIVLGGAGYSIFPQAVLDYLDADMGIQGEGEWVFPELIERLEKRADLGGVPGLYLKGRGLQGKRAFVHDLDDLPAVDVHGFLSGYDRTLWMPFQTRRGCPLNCSYCSTATIEGRSIRKRSPEKAVSELKCFAEAGFQQFYFVDNTFNLPASYAEELCRQIIRQRLTINWRCILYPGKLEGDLIKLMAEAGCREVSLGFESGCERILRMMNKRFTPEDIRRTSLALARHGIRQMGFLLLGGPGETRESVLESLSFADSLPLDTLKISQGIRIYPYTTLAGIAADEGQIKPDDDLLLPTFYMARGIEDWLKETVRAGLAEHPHWTS